MENSLDLKTQENIQAARALSGQKHGQYPLDFRSIGEALEVRAQAEPGLEYLAYYGEDSGGRESLSYEQFLERTQRLAAYFQTHFQIHRGDRVATLMFNHPLTVISYFSLWVLGAVVVPINVEESEERIRFILQDSGAKLLLCAREFAAKANNCASGIPIFSAQNPTGPSIQSAIQEPAVRKVKTIATGDDDALIVYTSGTTGMPKGVLLSQYNLLADARAISEWHWLAEKDRMMCVLPIHHVNGIVVTLITPLYAGATVVLNRRFSAGQFWKILSNEKVAIVSVVPTLLHFLYEKNDDIARYRLDSFRHFICGAGPLTVDLAHRFEERFGVRIVHGYGLSETTCYSCFLPVDLEKTQHQSWMNDHGFPSIGVPVPPNEMGIQDLQGNPLPAGQRGEIVIRGHNVMKGYYKNPDANRSAFPNPWFHSGDEGFFVWDEKNRPFFFITGRIKELIARGGVKFSPLEIDEVLNSIPGVRHGVAVGFENDAYGEEVGAYVELEPVASLSESQILSSCRAKLSFAKCPKVVKFGKDIPYTSTGKIQRGKLRPLFAEFKSRQFRDA